MPPPRRKPPVRVICEVFQRQDPAAKFPDLPASGSRHVSRWALLKNGTRGSALVQRLPIIGRSFEGFGSPEQLRVFGRGAGSDLTRERAAGALRQLIAYFVRAFSWWI